ncbi:putative glycoside hydrolase family 15 protein [Candidatus Woesearchaeota archaeon]|nr:putative glycoside hydrolase family 15 protein [Candidatus Woesearchaeota archaeon]
MDRRHFIGLAGALALGCANPYKAETDDDLERRINNVTYPSVFQAWSPADNLDEDPYTTLARHNLVFNIPPFYGLIWDSQPTGLAEGFTEESIQKALENKKRILNLNPNIVALAEIRYRDARKDFLPEGHRWWKYDENNEPIPGWQEGNYFLLDFSSPEFQDHVALRCKKVVETGVVDGVMLDWWDDDDIRLELIKKVRQSIGEKALILTNTNHRKTPRTSSYINGYFMECYQSETEEHWRQIAETLSWAELNLQKPNINCVETWYHNSREDLNLMRAVTTLTLTHSDGYCLFSDPNILPTPDHLHNWYSFWDADLGRPLEKGKKQNNNSFIREFENGTVVYNPMGNSPVEIQFSDTVRSVAAGKTGSRHILNPLDGDIYLK